MASFRYLDHYIGLMAALYDPHIKNKIYKPIPVVAPEITDAVVVGGSHAGLSAALTLYRALHSVVILDSHRPRNRYSSSIHLTPTWEHQDPEDFREASRAELEKSGLVQIVDTTVMSVSKLDNGLFEAVDIGARHWIGRKVLLAMGMEERFPDIDGYEENYPQKIFPCMFQFGYEQRGLHSAGLLALDGLANPVPASSLADDALKFTDTVTIYTNSNPTLAAQISDSLQTSDILVDDRKILRLSNPKESATSSSSSTSTGIAIEFVNGELKIEGFLVHRPITVLDRSIPEQLRLEYGPVGEIRTLPPFCKTNLEGVYAAGDCASMMKIIPNAINMGAYAGAGIARELPKRVTQSASRL